jgi:HlyD family secretion protein
VTTFFVRVGLETPPPGALPGLSSSVSIATARRAGVVTVPIQAVTSRAPKKPEDGKAESAPAPTPDAGVDDGSSATTVSGKPKPTKVVFVVKDGKAQMRPVKTGISSRTDVEILEGLAEGETIVDGPYRTLARELEDGQSVKPPEKDKDGEKKEGPSGKD